MRIMRVACGLLAAGGALFAGEVYLSYREYFTGMATYEQAVADHIVKNDGAWAGVGAGLHWLMMVFGVFAGLALVVLALLTALGQRWARAVSWLFGIPILLWYGLLAVLAALASSVVASDPGDDDPPELVRRYAEAWPSWLDTLDVVLMVSVVVLLVAALVGQTLPAAGRVRQSA